MSPREDHLPSHPLTPGSPGLFGETRTHESSQDASREGHERETHRLTDDPSSKEPLRDESFHVFYGESEDGRERLYRGERLHSAVVRKLYSLSLDENDQMDVGSSATSGDESASAPSTGATSTASSSPVYAVSQQHSQQQQQRTGVSRVSDGMSESPSGRTFASSGRITSESPISTTQHFMGADAPRASVAVTSSRPPISAVPTSHNVGRPDPRRTQEPNILVEQAEQVSMKFSRDEQRPKFISHYVLGAKLGEGSYAKVKEAMDTRTLRIVACKIVDKRFLRKVRDGLGNVRREIAIMRLFDSPHTMRLLDVIDEENREKLYMFLELSNGCTVQELMDRAPQKRLPTSQARAFFSQLVEGLEYIHSRNVVHRDIKPANLMLATDGLLKLADFGVAEFIDNFDAEGRTTRTVGSPAFQAPEIAKGEGVFLGRKVDAWAAGVTLYMMLTGEPPFKGSNYFELFRNISGGSFEMPDDRIDVDCQDLLKKLMTINPHDRMSVEDAREHAWLKKATPDDEEWIPIPRRHPKILDIVARLYENEDAETDPQEPDEITKAASSAAHHEPSISPTSSCRISSGAASPHHAGSDISVTSAGAESNSERTADEAEDGWRWNRSCRLM